MRHNHLRTFTVLIACISLVVLQSLFGQDNSAASTSADVVFEQVRSRLESGDTTKAIEYLDILLEEGGVSFKALLWRGKLYLAGRRFDEAGKDFNGALNSSDRAVRARALIGLGIIQGRNEVKTIQTLKLFKKAVNLDPTSFDDLYAPANIALMFRLTSRHRIAGEQLAKLVCRDILYPDAYRTWRELAIDKREGEIKDVDKKLEEFLKAHPDSAAWWVDLAMDRFYLEKADLALETLDELERANPDFVSPISRCFAPDAIWKKKTPKLSNNITGRPLRSRKKQMTSQVFSGRWNLCSIPGFTLTGRPATQPGTVRCFSTASGARSNPILWLPAIPVWFYTISACGRRKKNTTFICPAFPTGLPIK